jgi:hypothetical protein
MPGSSGLSGLMSCSTDRHLAIVYYWPEGLWGMLESTLRCRLADSESGCLPMCATRSQVTSQVEAPATVRYILIYITPSSTTEFNVGTVELASSCGMLYAVCCN